MLLGIVLVVIGLVYLLVELGVIATVSGAVVWPLLLMGFGIWLIWHRVRPGRRHSMWWCGPGRARNL